MLQWRLSIPVLVLVVTMLAVPLSRTNHRKGRFGKLLPAIVLYFTYLVALNAMRDALESGSVPMAVTIFACASGVSGDCGCSVAPGSAEEICCG